MANTMRVVEIDDQGNETDICRLTPIKATVATQYVAAKPSIVESLLSRIRRLAGKDCPS